MRSPQGILHRLRISLILLRQKTSNILLSETNPTQPIIGSGGIRLAARCGQIKLTLNPLRQRGEIVIRHGKFSKATDLVTVRLIAILIKHNRHGFVQPLIKGLGDLLDIFDGWPSIDHIAHMIEAALAGVSNGIRQLTIGRQPTIPI